MTIVIQKKIDHTANILIGACVAAIFIGAVTIVGELYTPLKDWLASVFSHHWIGKGWLAILMFVIVGMLSNKQQMKIADLANLTAILFWVSLLSALAIAGFFGYEVFNH